MNGRSVSKVVYPCHKIIYLFKEDDIISGIPNIVCSKSSVYLGFVSFVVTKWLYYYRDVF